MSDKKIIDKGGTRKEGYADALKKILSDLQNQGGSGMPPPPGTPKPDSRLNKSPVEQNDDSSSDNQDQDRNQKQNQSSNKSKSVNIGDRGDDDEQGKEIMQKEKAARNAEPEDEDEDEDNNDNKDSNKGSGNNKQSDQNKSNQSKSNQSKSNRGGVEDGSGGDATDNISDNAKEKAKNARLQRIKDKLSSGKFKNNITGETIANREKERAVKAAKDAKKFMQSAKYKFDQSIRKFINDAKARNVTHTWKKPNQAYAAQGLARKGRSMSRSQDIPTINVYYDRSGSWEYNETAKALGNKAVGELVRMDRQGLIVCKLFYFDVIVSSEDINLGGGTSAYPVIHHIQQTKPKNVIIITDNDTTYERLPDCIIDGTVWQLYYGGRSDALINHLHGKKATEIYDIDDSFAK